MKALQTVLLLAAWGVLTTAGRADDAKAKPFDVEVVKDIAYVEGKEADPNKHKLDLYVPKGVKDYPVLFWVHGGGWRQGDRKSFEKLGQTFAQRGVGVAAISYRLSPQVKHPAHVQDVAKAFAWVHKNIGKHGGRPDQIFISGHSAGGHLVALLALDPSYLKAEQLTPSHIKGVLPVSGPMRMTFSERMKEVFGDTEEAFKQASPLSHVNAPAAPFLILYAEKDPDTIRKTSAELAEALKKVKVDAEGLDVKDRDHGTIVRNIPNDKDPVTEAMLAFIVKHAKPKAKDSK